MKFGLREKKHAQTKLAILEVFVKHLDSGKHIEDLSNKEICNQVEISEATFYNYFPQKKDIFHYMFKLWELEMLWVIQKDGPDLKGLEYIREMSQAKYRCKTQSVKILSEILSVVIREGVDRDLPILSDAEVYLAFPGYEGILDIPRDKSYEEIYFDHLKYAQDSGEISADLDLELATLALIGVGIGSIVFLKDQEDADAKVQKVTGWHTNILLNALKK